MVAARSQHVATLLEDGRLLVAGGRHQDGYFARDAEVFDPADRRWTPAASMSIPRALFTATRMPNGRVFVTGGQTEMDVPGCPTDQCGVTETAEVYDPESNAWDSVASMTRSRYGHTATLLQDGRVLVAGGYGCGSGTSCGLTASASIFDPATESWSSAGDMNSSRIYSTASLLTDGRVLVAGGSCSDDAGCTASGYLTSAELYDPATNTWTSAAPMPSGRFLHSAVTLHDGGVLVISGFEDDPTLAPSGAIWDPETDEWKMISQPTVYSRGLATLLQDGRVLLAGGAGIGPIPPLSQTYDPVLDLWAPPVPMYATRTDFSMTTLTSGDVVVAGGSNCFPGVVQDTAEIYSALPLPANADGVLIFLDSGDDCGFLGF